MAPVSRIQKSPLKIKDNNKIQIMPQPIGKQFQQQQQPDLPIQIPFGWIRVVTPNNHSECIPSKGDESLLVYYITPSGHILLSSEDVRSYLDKDIHCKCYLNIGDDHLEMFNFDPTKECVQVEEEEQKKCKSTCEQWIRLAGGSSFLSEQILLSQSYLYKQQVCDMFEIYQMVTKVQQVEQQQQTDEEQFCQWLDRFSWEHILITREGNKYVKNWTEQQRQHFAYEFTLTCLQRPELLAISDQFSNDQKVPHVSLKCLNTKSNFLILRITVTIW